MGESKNRKNSAGGHFTMHIVSGMPAAELAEHVRVANEDAEALHASGRDHNEWLREQFTRELVFAVWPDTREPSGVGIAVLRGVGRVMLVSQGARPHAVTTATIRCRNHLEAQAMFEVYGDGRAKAA